MPFLSQFNISSYFTDLLRRRLGHFQRVDKLNIVEERSLRLIQQLQDLVLQLDQLALVGGDREHQAVLVLLQLGLLIPHHDAQQLRLQALLLHREVDDVGLGGDLWRVAGVAQLGGHVEAEAPVVLDLPVAQLQVPGAAHFLDALREHWRQARVQLLFDILAQTGSAHGDAQFELSPKERCQKQRWLIM